jgi:hypothetical protein
VTKDSGDPRPSYGKVRALGRDPIPAPGYGYVRVAMVFANMVLYIAADSAVNKPMPGMKRKKASRGMSPSGLAWKARDEE